jgi:YHS domain-containing protein
VTVVLLWIVRILVVLFVLRLLVRAVTGARTSQRRQARIGGSLVRDPQCGTYVPPARALTLSSRGQVLHFCSDRCRDAWTSSHG